MVAREYQGQVAASQRQVRSRRQQPRDGVKLAVGAQLHQRRPTGKSIWVDREGAILNEPVPQVALPIYIANMLKSLKAKSMEDDAQLGIMGQPNAFPSVPKASASDWTIMHSLCILTLRLTIAYLGSGHVWKTTVRELTDRVDDMRILVRNLKEWIVVSV